MERHIKMMEGIKMQKALNYSEKQRDLLSRIYDYLTSEEFTKGTIIEITKKLHDFEKEIEPIINEEFMQMLHECSETEFLKWKAKYPSQYDRWQKKHNPMGYEQRHSSQNAKTS